MKGHVRWHKKGMTCGIPMHSVEQHELSIPFDGTSPDVLADTRTSFGDVGLSWTLNPQTPESQTLQARTLQTLFDLI